MLDNNGALPQAAPKEGDALCMRPQPGVKVSEGALQIVLLQGQPLSPSRSAFALPCAMQDCSAGSDCALGLPFEARGALYFK